MINFCLSNERLCVFRLDQFIGVIAGAKYLTCSQVRYSAAELKQIAAFMDRLGLPAAGNTIRYERGEFWNACELLGVVQGKHFSPWKLLLHPEELQQIADLLEGQSSNGFSWKQCGF